MGKIINALAGVFIFLLVVFGVLYISFYRPSMEAWSEFEPRAVSFSNEVFDCLYEDKSKKCIGDYFVLEKTQITTNGLQKLTKAIKKKLGKRYEATLIDDNWHSSIGVGSESDEILFSLKVAYEKDPNVEEIYAITKTVDYLYKVHALQVNSDLFLE